MTKALKAVPQQKYQNCFEQLQHLWFKFISDHGEYVPARIQVCGLQ
jgi:hypothetical protein